MQIDNKSILVWDIENISYKEYNKIFDKLPYKPNKLFAISHNNLSKKVLDFLFEKNIKYIQCPCIADKRIIDVLNITKENTENLILVSSDSDFVPFIRDNNKNYKEIIVILKEKQQKRMLMKNNLMQKNLKFIILEQNPNVKKRISKTNKLIKNKNIDNKTNFKNKLSLKNIEDFFNLQKEKIDNNISSSTLEIKGKIQRYKTALNRINLDGTSNFKLYGKSYRGNLDYFYSLLYTIEKERREKREMILKTCPCCLKEKNVFRISNIEFCEDCEKLYIYEQDNNEEYKMLLHLDRYNKFIKETNKQIIENNFIDYSKSEKLNLIERDIEKKKPLELIYTKEELIQKINRLKKEL